MLHPCKIKLTDIVNWSFVNMLKIYIADTTTRYSTLYFTKCQVMYYCKVISLRNKF